MTNLITEIKDLKSNKKLVYINYEPAFCLYKSDIYKFGIEAENELSDEVYDEIISMLKKRALTRALYLFKDKDYTEYEISDKLSKAYYPPETIEYTLERLKKDHFINDLRYAYNYIQFKSSYYSKKVIFMKLRQKGVSLQNIESAYEEFSKDNCDTEYNTLVQTIQKKIKSTDVSGLSDNEKQKLIGFLYRKGFSYESIIKALNEFLDNEGN